MGWNTYGGYGFMGGFFGSFFMIVFWALVIWAIVALVARLAKQGTNETGKHALDILNERYAKGEIAQAEYEEKKKDLQA